jgi:hypothetical protein
LVGRTLLKIKSSFSSSGIMQADFLAKGAIEMIIGDLRQEIITGSSALQENDAKIFYPIKSLLMSPYRMDPEAPKSLIKMSSSALPFFGNLYYKKSPPENLASKEDPTDDPSSQGRFLNFRQWNQSYLMSSKMIAPQAYKNPDWILVTRQGMGKRPSSLDLLKISDRSKQNNSYVIGRYAYMVHDVGGLMPVNHLGGNQLVEKDFLL